MPEWADIALCLLNTRNCTEYSSIRIHSIVISIVRTLLCRVFIQTGETDSRTIWGSTHGKKKYAYSTWCSQAVTHLSTNHARRCLTSVIGREPVCSTWYGRRQQINLNKHIIIIDHNDRLVKDYNIWFCTRATQTRRNGSSVCICEHNLPQDLVDNQIKEWLFGCSRYSIWIPVVS